MSDSTIVPEVRGSSNRRWHPAAVGVALGAVVMTAGTFAPWLSSGTSERNLYSSAGLVQRLAGLGGAVGLALDALPLTGLYCIAAAAAYLMGRQRLAAGAVALLAVVFAGMALAVLSHRRPGEIHLLAVGPSVTLLGALLCLGVLLVAAGRSQHDTSIRRRTKRLLRTGPTPPLTSTTSASSTAPTTTPSSARPRTMEFR